MQEKISKVLEILKQEKIPASKIESDLNLANGVLGKTAKGIKGLSEENFQKVLEYFKKITGSSLDAALDLDKIEPLIAEKKQMVVDKKSIKFAPSIEATNKMKEVTDKLNKAFGAGTVMRMGDMPNQKGDVISTGSLLLNQALGIGGMPRGRIVEIFGPESSGKTTIAIHIMAEAQKLGLKCLLIDAENAFDPEYATNIGLDVDDMYICQPQYGEQGLQVADDYISSGKVGVVVIDSVAALIPKGELEGEMGDSKMGLHARLMSQACRKMVGIISKTNTLCIFLNQLRNKIGVMYGSPEVTTGGMALQFYASVRLDVRRQAKIMDGEVAMGNKTKVKVIKNKMAPPFRSAEFDIIYGEGIDNIGEIIDSAVEKNIIQKSGSWFAYDTIKLGQGRDAVKVLLKDNEELKEEILSKIENSQ